MNNGTDKITYTRDTATYTRNDIVLALAMMVCGFLYWNFIRIPALGAGVTLFATILSLCTAIYLRSVDYHQTGKSLLCLIVLVMSALVFLLFDNILIKGLNFIFLSAAVIYWVCLSTGRTLEKRISVYILGDFYNQVLVIPISNFTRCFGAVKKLIAGNKKGKSLVSGAVGILVILPVLAVVINLLIRADAAFAGMIENLEFSFSMDIIIQILFGIPLACYLYGLIYGNRYGKNTGSVTVESVDNIADSLRIAPGVTVYTALTALNLVFIVFFLSQITYFFSAFNNLLPELMTHAEYARRGFFELCTVAGINMIVITASHLFVKREKVRMLQIETVGLCFFTLMLIMTALSKMVMYINYYGLTQLRVYTTWFMIVLFFLFAVIAVRQFKKFNSARAMLLGFVILFMILSYGNVDGRIAAYNIDKYRNETLESLDVQALSSLSEAATPYIYDLYLDTTDFQLKADLKTVLVKGTGVEKGAQYQETFRDFNFQSYTAEKIRNML